MLQTGRLQFYTVSEDSVSIYSDPGAGSFLLQMNIGGFMSANQADHVFENSDPGVGSFCFDDTVAEVFSDMASRSIPGYGTIADTIGRIGAVYATRETSIYDLGCSLGEVTLSLRRRINPDLKNRIIAVDNSPAMIERCRSRIMAYRSAVPVEIVLGDIGDIKIENASVAVLNFVLQFIDPSCRNQILRKICDGLNPGGILIISETLHQEDSVLEDLLTDLYLDFKRSNGYSELEISRKRTALENVLIPDTWNDLSHRLTKAGFSHVGRWFQTYNFCCCIAIT